MVIAEVVYAWVIKDDIKQGEVLDSPRVAWQVTVQTTVYLVGQRMRLAGIPASNNADLYLHCRLASAYRIVASSHRLVS